MTSPRPVSKICGHDRITIPRTYAFVYTQPHTDIPESPDSHTHDAGPIHYHARAQGTPSRSLSHYICRFHQSRSRDRPEAQIPA
ncbi:hypothetical protein JB92DRAFT_2918988 [Gautieria morchelliformis]|nr:hypothetical protein JB92DRAFT_3022353 [Gautieria morchelliformis]KAF8514482.1 hypothetical protein JB92DRAFT_2918988 [Gautieria morchelliformis]